MQVRIAAKSSASLHDLANLRSFLLAKPFNSAIPHEVRGTVWLLLLRLRSEDLLAEDANLFAQSARHSVTDENSREQIEKDVERTRPGLARFKQPAVRGALLRLLSLFCARHKVAYIQGFNELLAPFVLLADTGGNPRIVYALFSEFVSRFAPWMLETSETKVFDVLKRLFKYFGRLLLYHDPELYWLLERHMMTPDLYATSWFVTLFARNFTVESVMALWDLLLLEDNPLGTSFFGIALLCSRRDELLSVDESRIPETLMMLTADSPEEVRRLWKIGSDMRVNNTPPSFQRLMTDRLLSSPVKPTRSALSAARAMQASVCLQTTPDDLVASEAHYFTWDCRTEAEYSAGHLAQAAFLPLDALRDANGKITQETSEAARAELQNAVNLCEPLKNTSHICLVGSGIREEDNLDINMLALYLTRIGIPYVSTLRGGFEASLVAMKADDSLSSVELVDYDAKRYEHARRVRLARQKKKLQSEKAKRHSLSSANGRRFERRSNGDGARNLPTDQADGPSGVQAISSFLEKTDAEVSKALSKALNGMGLRYSLSTLSGGASGEGENSSAEPSPENAGTNRYNLFSPNAKATPAGSSVTSGTDTPSKRLSDGSKQSERSSSGDHDTMGRIRRSNSSLASGSQKWTEDNGANAIRRNGLASAENSPRFLDVPSSTMSPRPGVQVNPSTEEPESPIRSKTRGSGGIFSSQKSPWGRDATPGWLGDETLTYPLSSIPKGFTVNVMDDRVMAGLRLFPCKARSSRGLGLRGRSSEFKRRYVGVSGNYLLLLSPHHNRNHLLEVKLIRYLQDITRITFKRSRPELVTFEIAIGPEEDAPTESVVCLMPDGLRECVALIKKYIADDEDEGSQEEDSANGNSEASGSDENIDQTSQNEVEGSKETDGECKSSETESHTTGSGNPGSLQNEGPSNMHDVFGGSAWSTGSERTGKSHAEAMTSPVSAIGQYHEQSANEVEFGEFQSAASHDRGKA